MPFVRGRYYINRVLGEALEGAREAEAALAALQEEEKGSDLTESGNRKGGTREPIRRVEWISCRQAERTRAMRRQGRRSSIASTVAGRSDPIDSRRTESIQQKRPPQSPIK